MPNSRTEFPAELAHLRSVYLAFDLFPSSKGAATHIGHMAATLFDQYDGGALVTLGNRSMSPVEQTTNVISLRFTKQVQHYLDRAQQYAHFCSAVVQKMTALETAHFRDIWSGLGVFNSDRHAQSVFEVNGLPSIELPYHYPSLPSQTLEKIAHLERRCLTRANAIVVPSQVIAEKLASLGTKESNITVIPNAADPEPEYADIDTTHLGDYLIYFGATQAWQGVDVLLKAFAQLRDKTDLRLVICSSTKERATKHLRKLASRLNIEDRVTWFYQLPKTELNCYIRGARLSVAPLMACSRNIEQGCSPLKIYESMACNTAVVASDLPVTREILTPDVTGKLVAPDRPQELARTIRVLLEYPQLSQSLADAAKQHLTLYCTWEKSKRSLATVYDNLHA